METILDQIIANKRIEIEKQKKETPLRHLEELLANTTVNTKSFREALLISPTGIIAEFKRKSPSRNWIAQEAKIEEVVPFYSLKGASAISILTDLVFFGGDLSDLTKAHQLTDTPLLRKDFIIDSYQLFQAKLSGASAILLIAATLSPQKNIELATVAHSLGLEVLLEIHKEEELDYLNDNVDVVGINNRNLATFTTDIQLSFTLGKKIPSDFLKISESGISNPQTVIDLRKEGFKGFLMGENFMKTKNPSRALGEFIYQLL